MFHQGLMKVDINQHDQSNNTVSLCNQHNQSNNTVSLCKCYMLLEKKCFSTGNLPATVCLVCSLHVDLSAPMS